MNVIITSEKGINITEIEAELRNGTLLSRVVTILDSMPLSDRNLTADISLDEMYLLRSDNRILQVERLEEMVQRSIPVRDVVQSINPVLIASNNTTHDNWGLDYCTEDEGSSYRYSHEGDGVDIVVMDSGIRTDHTEFNDSNSVSRIQQIEWAANQNVDKPQHYTDQDGHGTHTSGTCTGLTQGWARNARIYSIKIFDTDAYQILEAIQLVRAWHNAKSGADADRPTVMNNSWGYEAIYPSNYPDVALRDKPHPVRVASIDAEIESLITDGAIVVASAGNSAAYIAKVGAPEYNDSYYTDATFNWVATAGEATYQYYYKRKSPSGANGVICVGSIGDDTPSVDKNIMSYFSNFGPRVDIFAPGYSIQSADITSTIKLTKRSGTSMSAPQVSGIIAIYLSMNPTATLSDVNTFLSTYGKIDIVTGPIQGAVNLAIRSIYNSVYIKDNGIWKSSMPERKVSGAWIPVKEMFNKTTNTIHKVFG